MEQTNELKTLFPNLDADLCEEVLRECGNDFERALNSLLEISDPSSKAAIPSVTQSDEDYARNLQDRYCAEQLEMEMNKEQITRAAEMEKEEDSPLFDKLASFGESAKQKIKEFYGKITNKEGAIALKYEDS